MSASVSVRLPDDLGARLDALAARTRQPKAVYLRQALEESIGRLEWEQRIMQNVDDVRAGRRQTIPAAQVRKRLGLDG